VDRFSVPTLGKDERGISILGMTVQGKRSVPGPVPLHNAIVGAMAEALSAVAAQGASGFVGYQAAVQLL
jgi:hypothetical protein